MKEMVFSETTVMTYLCIASEKQLQKLERAIAEAREINNRKPRHHALGAGDAGHYAYRKYGKRSQK